MMLDDSDLPIASTRPSQQEAAPGEAIDPHEATLPYVTFRVGATRLAIPADFVEEFVAADAVYLVPLTPPHVLGLMNYRGHALPVIDLGAFLSLCDDGALRSADGTEADDDRPVARVVVVSTAGMELGIRCDGITGIVELAPSELTRPEVAWGERLREFAMGEALQGGALVVALDLPRLLEAARVCL